MHWRATSLILQGKYSSTSKYDYLFVYIYLQTPPTQMPPGQWRLSQRLLLTPGNEVLGERVAVLE